LYAGDSFSAACLAPPFRQRPTVVRSPGWYYRSLSIKPLPKARAASRSQPTRARCHPLDLLVPNQAKLGYPIDVTALARLRRCTGTLGLEREVKTWKADEGLSYHSV
jgi:hypothetical protein